MKKILLVIIAAATLILSGCDQFFSELEITFFNMKRIAYIQMDITMDDIPDEEPINLIIKTDGFHQITETSDEIAYTYLDYRKDVYELTLIDDQYYSYKLDKLGAYDLDINTIMEIFLLAPQDFKKDDDGFYRPTVILYDFTDLEFKVSDGYITEMNFKLNTNDDLISMSILFSDVNAYELAFPEYTQFTPLEQAAYFLDITGHTIQTYELGFDITVNDLTLSYTLPTDYLTFTNSNGEVIYYDIRTGYLKEEINSQIQFTVAQYKVMNSDFDLSSVNFMYLNDYCLNYTESHINTTPEEVSKPFEPDTIEAE